MRQVMGASLAHGAGDRQPGAATMPHVALDAISTELRVLRPAFPRPSLGCTHGEDPELPFGDNPLGRSVGRDKRFYLPISW
jgi:hypothetical protein